MLSSHAALSALVPPLAPEDELTKTVTQYQCGQDAALCNFVDQFADANWILAFTDLLVAKGVSILFIIGLALFARWLVRRSIDKFTLKAASGTVPQRWRWRDKGEAGTGGAAALLDERRAQRAQTMGSVLRSIATAVIFTMAGVMVLEEFGIPVGPILASAGILGVALGFGSQTLVKDFISGIFMLIEDQYGVGDVIDTGEATGAVEAVGLRVTRLRDIYGAVWYVRNGEIIRIGNHSQGWARAVVDLPVPYTEDIGRMNALLKSVADELWQDEVWNEVILEEPEVWGVEAMAADAVVMRVVFKAAPLKQWEIAREMRQRVKDLFDRENIEIPFPQRTVWLRHEQRPQSDDGAVGHDGQDGSHASPRHGNGSGYRPAPDEPVQPHTSGRRDGRDQS